MRSPGIRTLVTTIVAIGGAVLGLGAAMAFNVAGVVVTSAGFSQAAFWEPVEGNITVFFGSLLLLGWLGSVIALITSSRKARTRGEKRANMVAAILSVSVVVTALIISVVVLPAQYGWATY